MKTWMAVLAALALCMSCAEKAEPLKTYYRVRGRAGTQVYERVTDDGAQVEEKP